MLFVSLIAQSPRVHTPPNTDLGGGLILVYYYWEQRKYVCISRDLALLGDLIHIMMIGLT